MHKEEITKVVSDWIDRQKTGVPPPRPEWGDPDMPWVDPSYVSTLHDPFEDLFYEPDAVFAAIGTLFDTTSDAEVINKFLDFYETNCQPFYSREIAEPWRVIISSKTKRFPQEIGDKWENLDEWKPSIRQLDRSARQILDHAADSPPTKSDDREQNRQMLRNLGVAEKWVVLLGTDLSHEPTGELFEHEK